MKKNRLDLYLSAHDAARASLQITGKVAEQEAKIAAFKASGLAEANFDLWVQDYTTEREKMLMFNGTAVAQDAAPSATTPAPSPAPQA